MKQKVCGKSRLLSPRLVLRHRGRKSGKENEGGRDDLEGEGLIRVAVLRGHEEESR